MQNPQPNNTNTINQSTITYNNQQAPPKNPSNLSASLSQKPQDNLAKKMEAFQIQQPPPPPPPQKAPQVKNIFKLTIILFTISLSSFYFGYSLTYLSTIPKSTLRKYYGPMIDNASTIPVLSGAMPFGAIFGSLLANVLMRYFTRRRFLVFVNVLALILNLIIQITNVWVLLLCRLVNGVFVGLYLGLIPSYIKELCPHSVSGMFGSFSQLQHIIGNVVSYLIGMIFYLSNSQGELQMRFQYEFTSIFIILQMVLIFIDYIPESPNSLIQQNRLLEAKQVLLMFNDQQQAQKYMKQKMLQNGQIQELRITKEEDQSGNNLQKVHLDTSLISDNKPVIKKENIQMTSKSYFISFQIPLTQQLSGVNFIVTQMTVITALYDQSLSHYTGLISNLVQLVGTASSAFILKKYGRRPIFLLGSMILTIINILTGFSFLGLNRFEWSPGFPISMVLIIIFNFVYGITTGPIIWLYVAEIAKKSLVPVATANYWVGCSFCVIVPSIITNIMGSPYASFFFFAGWQIIFFVPNYFYMVETKGLSAAQISRKFKQLD